ncbi:MAG: FIST C-terminal domain-containing protein [Nitrososphaera sp.]|nr:FIST C-terminal domain-containing protein [Nitrososphaera sp.]
MKLEQTRWVQGFGWEPKEPGTLGDKAELVLVFGDRRVMEDRRHFDSLKRLYPNAQLLGCSTAGEIYNTQVTDESLVVTAVQFEHTRVASSSINIDEIKCSFEAGKTLAESLEKRELVHVFVFSDGLGVNGSDLVKGLTSNLPEDVTVTGGLSGDGDRFTQTLVIRNGYPEKGAVTAIGLYGKRLKVGYGSLGGWDSFGPERLVTKSKGNVLYGLDGKSALELYKKYLGEHAKGLPATGLLFPLSLRTNGEDTPVVRTILSVNEEEQSMTFAGDIPEGSYVRLMKANFDRLIDGAAGAAQTSHQALQSSSPDLAILISCVGRKMVLKQRIEEEVEGVRDIMGEGTVLTGFYSYGEISPFTPNAKCELHNQTMTITAFKEE